MPAVVFDPIKIKRVRLSIKSSSPGPDKIHPKILKNLVYDLAIPWAVIFTNSCNSSSIPNAWKSSFVCPICKGFGSRFLFETYRPVSLTSVVCKTMESIIKDNFIHHLSPESLLSPFQHGFLPKKIKFICLFIHFF